MATHKVSKINQLIKKWPRGTVGTFSWLARQGVSRFLAKAYERTSWLKHIGHGACARADSPVDWTGGLYSVQSHLKRPIHAGGKTALQLFGLAHFLPHNVEVIHLFGPSRQKLPAWFLKYKWGVRVRHHMTDFLSTKNSLGLIEKDFGDYSIWVSGPERAIMEHLYLLPSEESYEESRLLMEGLLTLRPALVRTLLEHCSSVKVKRLFLALAEEFKHSWLEQLKLSKIDLGKGKRVIFKNGHLHPKYQITLPKP